jgi:putative ABC transport system permease protein
MLRNGLVVAEVALAVVLLISSALLVQSFLRMRSVDLGIDPENVLTMWLTLPEAKYASEEELGVFQKNLLERLDGIPSIAAAGLSTGLPTQGFEADFYVIASQGPPDDGQRPFVGVRRVTPGYFPALGIRLLRGRLFEGNDDASGPPVVLVNESFAQRHWPDSDPLGERIEFSSGSADIVGVVGDVRVWGPTVQPPAMAYFPLFGAPARSVSLALRTDADPGPVVEPVGEAVLSLDPDQPVFAVRAMTDLLSDYTARETVMAKVMGVLAGIALVLALVGVYGVMAYSVSRRTHEMGIRMALGADAGKVLGLVLWQGALYAALGIGIGLLMALGVTRGLASFLFGVSPFHLPTFLGVSLFLLMAGIAATFFPAQRATKVDPIIALRSE